jgi:hypothetical protein
VSSLECDCVKGLIQAFLSVSIVYFMNRDIVSVPNAVFLIGEFNRRNLDPSHIAGAAPAGAGAALPTA